MTGRRAEEPGAEPGSGSPGRLFSYTVTHDTGFAPNPFWGWCTLATCKPLIRRSAQVGDWVAGLSPKATGNRLVYAMRVGERLPFDAYFTDPRFASKKPVADASARVRVRGDNIYQPGSRPGEFDQLPSLHSRHDGSEDPQHTQHDLSGLHVLIARRFWYFGGSGPQLPPALELMKVGRGHRCNFPDAVIEEFTTFVTGFPTGVLGRPTLWDPGDESWKGGPP